MYMQKEYLRESVNMALGSTYRIDLPEQGLLSSILLNIQASAVSGYSLANELWRLQDHLGKVEVIANGSQIIKSVDFKHLQFFSWMRQGIVPFFNWRNYASNTMREFAVINFGRWIGDTEYGLDLSRYDNVELRITNASSASITADDLTLSLLQVFMRDGAGAFKGHLRTELWRQWTAVSDEIKYLVLPTEYPISGIYLRALPETSSGAAETGMSNPMDDIDFSLQGGLKRYYKGGIDDLLVLNSLERGAEVITSGLADVTADRGIQVGIGRVNGFAGMASSKDGAIATSIATVTADETDGTIRFEVREADSPVHFITKGIGFQNIAWLLHSQQLLTEELVSFPKDGEVRLNIHTRSGAGYAGGTNEVLLERLVA
jgi:hypothetical protein